MLSLFQDESIQVTKEQALEQARTLLISFLNKGKIPTWDEFKINIDLPDHHEIIHEFYQKLIYWNFLDHVLEAEATEFYFHGPENSQILTPSGKKMSLKLPLSLEEWQLWLEIVSITFKQNWNTKNPFCSFYAHLHGKHFRFSMVHFSTSAHGNSKLILRHIRSQQVSLSDFGTKINLKSFIDDKKNILIAGSTGSGKTTLLTSFVNHIPSDEHLIILEDTYEIISTHPHQTRFLSSAPSDASLKDFLSYSLRLSPDRMILGEMRSHEVIPFLMAMNTGHKGLMGTIHASSAQEALSRMALLFTLYAPETHLNFEKVMDLICQNIGIVIFMENKKIKEIIRIYGSDKGVAFYESIEGHKELSLF